MATRNTNLPVLAESSVNKFARVNEILERIDAILPNNVVRSDLSAPSDDALIGRAYVVADNATGEWEGRETQIAFYLGGTGSEAWFFVTPLEGHVAYDQGLGYHIWWNGGEWTRLTLPRLTTDDMRTSDRVTRVTTLPTATNGVFTWTLPGDLTFGDLESIWLTVNPNVPSDADEPMQAQVLVQSLIDGTAQFSLPLESRGPDTFAIEFTNVSSITANSNQLVFQVGDVDHSGLFVSATVEALYLVSGVGSLSLFFEGALEGTGSENDPGRVRAAGIATRHIAHSAITPLLIADNAVLGIHITDGAVSAGKLADEAVTARALAPGSVGGMAFTTGGITAAAIGNEVVSEEKMANRAVSERVLADDSVSTRALRSGSATTDIIADRAITRDKLDPSIDFTLPQDVNVDLTDGQVEERHIANGAVSSVKIATNAVITSKIPDGAITRSKIQGSSVDASKLADGAVSSPKILNNAVTSAKLASDSVVTSKIDDLAVISDKLANDAVTTLKVDDLAITTAKLANQAVTQDKLANDSVGRDQLRDNTVSPEHLQDNAVGNPAIADDAVGTDEIQDGAITGDKIANRSVTSDHIADGTVIEADVADGAVTSVKIADDAVIEGKIADGAITLGKMASNSVGASQIVNGSVGSSELASNSVTSSKIASSAVGNSEIANGAVSLSKLGSNSVDSSKIRDGSVNSAKLGSNSVITVKIQDGAVTNPKIGNLAVSEGKIANDAVTTAKVRDDAITQAKLANESVGALQIEDNAVNQGHLTSNSVGNSELQSNSVGTSKIQDGAITGAKIANGSVTNAKLSTNLQSTISNLQSRLGSVNDNSVTTVKLVDGAVTQDKISGGYLAPAGGTTGQVLAKASNTDGDMAWMDGSAVGTGLRTSVITMFSDTAHSTKSGGTLTGNQDASFKRVDVRRSEVAPFTSGQDIWLGVALKGSDGTSGGPLYFKVINGFTSNRADVSTLTLSNAGFGFLAVVPRGTGQPSSSFLDCSFYGYLAYFRGDIILAVLSSVESFLEDNIFIDGIYAVQSEPTETTPLFFDDPNGPFGHSFGNRGAGARNVALLSTDFNINVDGEIWMGLRYTGDRNRVGTLLDSAHATYVTIGHTRIIRENLISVGGERRFYFGSYHQIWANDTVIPLVNTNDGPFLLPVVGYIVVNAAGVPTRCVYSGDSDGADILFMQDMWAVTGGVRSLRTLFTDSPASNSRGGQKTGNGSQRAKSFNLDDQSFNVATDAEIWIGVQESDTSSFGANTVAPSFVNVGHTRVIRDNIVVVGTERRYYFSAWTTGVESTAALAPSGVEYITCGGYFVLNEDGQLRSVRMAGSPGGTFSQVFMARVYAVVQGGSSGASAPVPVDVRELLVERQALPKTQSSAIRVPEEDFEGKDFKAFLRKSGVLYASDLIKASDFARVGEGEALALTLGTNTLFLRRVDGAPDILVYGNKAGYEVEIESISTAIIEGGEAIPIEEYPAPDEEDEGSQPEEEGQSMSEDSRAARLRAGSHWESEEEDSDDDSGDDDGHNDGESNDDGPSGNA